MMRAIAGMVLLALACATPPKEVQEPDLSAVRIELDSVWARYSSAAVAGDADAVAQLFTDSAYVAEMGLPIMRGNSSVRAVAGEVLESTRILESTIRPELTEAAGNRMLQFGTYKDVLQARGQPTQVTVGHFAAVLERDSAAAWRVTRLFAFADSTVPQSTTGE